MLPSLGLHTGPRPPQSPRLSGGQLSPLRARYLWSRSPVARSIESRTRAGRAGGACTRRAALGHTCLERVPSSRESLPGLRVDEALACRFLVSGVTVTQQTPHWMASKQNRDTCPLRTVRWPSQPLRPPTEAGGNPGVRGQRGGGLEHPEGLTWLGRCVSETWSSPTATGSAPSPWPAQPSRPPSGHPPRYGALPRAAGLSSSRTC